MAESHSELEDGKKAIENRETFSIADAPEASTTTVTSTGKSASRVKHQYANLFGREGSTKDCKKPIAKIGYFSLPREIRDEIMRLVLCPGHIYLPGPDMPAHKLRPKPALYPGIQLLATCRQAYIEGHELYYSSNVFHMPHGPLAHMQRLLGAYHVEHLQKMRNIRIRCSVLDLHGADYRAIDLQSQELIEWRRAAHKLPALSDIAQAYSQTAANTLKEVWTLKLAHFRHTFAWTKTEYIRIQATVAGSDKEFKNQIVWELSIPEKLDGAESMPTSGRLQELWWGKLGRGDKRLAQLLRVAEIEATKLMHRRVMDVGWQGSTLCLEADIAHAHEGRMKNMESLIRLL